MSRCASPPARAERLAVIDDGPGIPDDERHRAGERFFRGRNQAQPGSGLGLAIVRSIAERHGGGLRSAAARAGAASPRRSCCRRPMRRTQTLG